MQRKDTARLLADIRAIWSYFDTPETALDLWTRALADLEPESVTRALEAWISESPKPPTPADLRRIATAGSGPKPLANAPAGNDSDTITHYRELDPATGEYRPLPEPVTYTHSEAAEAIRRSWAEYHRLNPPEIPFNVITSPEIPHGIVAAVGEGKLAALRFETAPDDSADVELPDLEPEPEPEPEPARIVTETNKPGDRITTASGREMVAIDAGGGWLYWEPVRIVPAVPAK